MGCPNILSHHWGLWPGTSHGMFPQSFLNYLSHSSVSPLCAFMFNQANTWLDQRKNAVFLRGKPSNSIFYFFYCKTDCSTAATASTSCIPSSSYSAAFKGRFVYVTAAQMSYGLMEYTECMLARGFQRTRELRDVYTCNFNTREPTKLNCRSTALPPLNKAWHTCKTANPRDSGVEFFQRVINISHRNYIKVRYVCWVCGVREGRMGSCVITTMCPEFGFHSAAKWGRERSVQSHRLDHWQIHFARF